MTIYKKVSGPDDVMTFCGEKKPMGKGLVQDGLDALAHVAVDPTDEVDLTREYEQFVIG